MSDLKEAFEELRTDEVLAKQFAENPFKVLRDLGVDTMNVAVREVEPEEAAAQAALERGSMCFSIGCILCFSVG